MDPLVRLALWTQQLIARTAGTLLAVGFGAFVVYAETERLDEAALVAPCLGYRSATLPIFDADGRRLVLRADRNGDAVGDDCRVLLADGTKLPNVFGIGLGTGFRPSEAMGCEPNFNGQANSLWLYQNDMGSLIYHAIQAMPAKEPAVAA